MATPDVCRALIDYNLAAWNRVWDGIETLDDAAFVAPVDYSHGSLRDHMLHVATVEEGWLRGLEGDPEARGYRIDPEQVPDAASLRALWSATAERWAAYAAGLDEASCDETLPGMNGPTWQVITHIVNHGTDHRAQVLRVLHDAGAPTFDQDAIYHFWFGGLPEPKGAA